MNSKLIDDQMVRRQRSAGVFIYARALLEYVIIIMWVRSVIKMLRSVKSRKTRCSLSLFSVKNA